MTIGEDSPRARQRDRDAARDSEAHLGYPRAMSYVASSFYAVFGLVAAGGGVMGFVKAKSRASLVAGLVSGALLFGTSGLFCTHRTIAGAALGGLVSLALVGRFGPAFAKTKKLMPAGLVAGLGVVGVLVAVGAALS
jgi:uncharacterized membrane protein (UPF0136 family)